MQAVILAGGLGTRLLPLTSTLPKSLVPVAGKPFIDWQLTRLRESGFDRVLLCIGHLGELVREHVGDGRRFELAVSYAADGPTQLGTAGALRHALSQLDSTFLLTYGDSYLPFDYAAPLDDLNAHPAAFGTMSVFPNQDRWDRSNTRVEGERVVRYDKHAAEGECDYIDYGAMALRREAIAALSPSLVIGLDAVQSALASAGRLRAYIATERFYEIGTSSGLAELERHLRGAR